jgi:hypothetical protein
MDKVRFIPILALALLLIVCGTAQASITLQITVRDAIDGSPVNGASVIVNGVTQGSTTSDGTFYLAHSGNTDLLVNVSKAGYVDSSVSVGKDQATLAVNLTRESLVLSINLFDSRTFAMITNGKITVTSGNTSVSKSSDASGLFSFNVLSGYTYALDISAPNYYPLTKSVTMGVENKQAQYYLLRSDLFSFQIKDKSDMSPLQGADVYVDETLVGTSDENGVVTTQIVRELHHAIKVSKTGYIQFVAEKTILASDAVMLVPLSRSPYSVFVSVFDESKSPVQGAGIYLGGVLKGVTDQYGQFGLSEISGGTYQLEVRQSGFVSKSQQVVITKNGQSITVELDYELADVTIFVQDSDKKIIPAAQVLVDNLSVGSTDDHGQLTTKLKVNTHHNVTARKDGYQTASTDKIVLPGSTASTVTLTMERSMDWGFILLMIGGAIGVIAVFVAIRFIGRRGPKRLSHKGGL